MGYTHFFQQQREITDKEWEGIMADASCILQATINSGIPLACSYEEQEDPPVVSAAGIYFNGVGEGRHEDFYLPRKMDPPHGYTRDTQASRYRFNFCKTARKPYDVAVGAIMLSMHHHAPGAWALGSDGDSEEKEWVEATFMYFNATGQERTLINTSFLNREKG